MSRVRVIDREESDSEINLTPMLDVVFIMLVFFLVTSSFVRERGLAATTSDDTARSPAPEPTSLVVRIDDENRLWLDERLIDPAALRSHLVRLHALNPEFPVVVVPSNESTADMLVRVIDAAVQADIEDVAVAEVRTINR